MHARTAAISPGTISRAFPASSAPTTCGDPGVLVRQAALAREYGIHGFCYYYYWFDGKRLLERPVEAMRTSGTPDFPYCLCWANENWTRRWDGARRRDPDRASSRRARTTSASSATCFPHFRDPRYIRVAGKPLFIVYRATGMLPDAARDAGAVARHLPAGGRGRALPVRGEDLRIRRPDAAGFDAAVEFPPHGMRRRPTTEQVDIVNPDFRGTIIDYRQFVVDTLAAVPPGYPCAPHGDPGLGQHCEAAGRGIDVHQCFTRNLRGLAARKSLRARCANDPPGERLVFVNAWNEWSEAAYLEPDARYGRQYLLATRRALGTADPAAADPKPSLPARGSPPRDRRAASARRAAASRGPSAPSP